jgi:hypothetical protein
MVGNWVEPAPEVRRKKICVVHFHHFTVYLDCCGKRPVKVVRVEVRQSVASAWFERG